MQLGRTKGAILLNFINPGYIIVNIFLLEDQPLNLQIMSAYLAEITQPRIVHRQTVAQARRFLHRHSVDAFPLIILDVVLPDGLSLELQDLFQDRERAKLIAYTARCTPADIAEYDAAGFDAVLEKPLSFARFREVVMPMLGAANEPGSRPSVVDAAAYPG